MARGGSLERDRNGELTNGRRAHTLIAREREVERAR